MSERRPLDLSVVILVPFDDFFCFRPVDLFRELERLAFLTPILLPTASAYLINFSEVSNLAPDSLAVLFFCLLRDLLKNRAS